MVSSKAKQSKGHRVYFKKYYPISKMKYLRKNPTNKVSITKSKAKFVPQETNLSYLKRSEKLRKSKIRLYPKHKRDFNQKLKRLCQSSLKVQKRRFFR
jgi:hypothetical protein